MSSLCLASTLLAASAPKAEPRLLVCPISDGVFLSEATLGIEQEYVFSEGNWRISVSTNDGSPITGFLYRKYETNNDWIYVGPFDRSNGLFQTPVFALPQGSFFLVRAACDFCVAIEINVDCTTP